MNAARLLPTLAALLWGGSAPPALCEAAKEQTQQELETVRERIKVVEQDIAAARDRSDALREELKDNELQAAAILQRVATLREQIRARQEGVRTLSSRQHEQEQALRDERQQLGRQLRAAWQLGRNDYVKLLLNQEDPTLVGRMLAWHAWHGRARGRQIAARRGELRALATRRAEITKESNALRELQVEQEEKLQTYEDFRASREAIIAKLQDHMQTQGTRLGALREDERELSALFDELGRRAGAAPGTPEALLPPFSSLRGTLDWPLQGRLLRRFGQKREVGNNLKWSGVLLDAEPGDAVHTIGNGQVVYADWLRGLGMLLIVDHGEGYTSLYGYNRKLLKKTGDWVLAGEIIANVGDSGGQSRPGLYFEIRKDGAPVNPVQWCRSGPNQG